MGKNIDSNDIEHMLNEYEAGLMSSSASSARSIKLKTVAEIRIKFRELVSDSVEKPIDVEPLVRTLYSYGLIDHTKELVCNYKTMPLSDFRTWLHAEMYQTAAMADELILALGKAVS